MTPLKKCAFLTDVEGNLDYLERYLDISHVLCWSDDKKELKFKDDDSEFVFGGDSQDKGVGDIRFVKLLLNLKRKHPDRVHLLIGNRDCNKLRLSAELHSDAIADEAVQKDEEFPYWIEKQERISPQKFVESIGSTTHTQANRLRWMLKHSMDADGAFERRKRELAIIREVEHVSDEDVVNSFVREVDPGKTEENFMLQYLEHGELAHKFGTTLFVHGGISEANMGVVPGKKDPEKVEEWVKELNAWKEQQVADFKKNPTKGKTSKERAGYELMTYGVPDETGKKTVICASNLVDGNATPLSPEVVEYLSQSQITTVVAGHVPHGDCPTVIRTKEVTLIIADLASSKPTDCSKQWGLEGSASIDSRGGLAVSEVLVWADGKALVHGKRDDGTEIEYELPTSEHGDEESLVGEQLQSGFWVKAQLKVQEPGGSEAASSKPAANTGEQKGSQATQALAEYLVCRGNGGAIEHHVWDDQKVREDMLEQRIKSSIPKKEHFGLLEWESRPDEAPRPYMRVPIDKKNARPEVHPIVLRFVLEHHWGLNRPNVLLTVTGGAQDFDLDAEDKDELLQGLTDTAKSVGAWFTTGGTSAGIMKYMGLARRLYANDIPLIGIATFGVVQGRDAMRTRDAASEDNEPVKYESACGDPQKNNVEIDVNHSHFLFADDGTTGNFGKEFKLRGQLEAAICCRDPKSRQVWNAANREGQLWRQLQVREEGLKRARVTEEIPSACVCVQGGPGTINTVCSSVESGTPVLLVRGSGKAADLIADLHTVHATGTAAADGEHVQLLRKVLSSQSFARAASHQSAGSVGGDLVDEDLVAIFKYYGMAPKGEKARESMLKQVVKLVTSKPKGFAVYDLDAREGAKGDLKAGLLKCILEWKEHDLEAEDVERIRTTTVLAVKWNKPDILGEVLSNEKSKMSKKGNIRPYLQVVEDGLLEALCSGSEQCVEMLIEHGADITEFGVERKFFRKQKLSDEDRVRRCRQVLRWKILMKSCGDSQKTQHVMVMLEQVKDKFKGESNGGKTIIRVPADDHKVKSIVYTYEDLRDIAKKLDKPNWKATLYSRDLDSTPPGKLNDLFYGAVDSLSRLDTLYRELMGESWCFSAGTLGKTWDLFLCMVLMNRHAIAKICWSKIEAPVLAALVACKMYRAMAEKQFVRAEVRQEMKENANEFEQIATDVMLLAMEEDMLQAVESLETRTGFLSGSTLFDLAIDCDARIFVTKCCKQATDQRFFGDLLETNLTLSPSWLQIPSWLGIFFCLFTGGLAAPFCLDFRLPPDAESCRGPAQRRKIPKGYPHQPTKNKILTDKYTAETLEAKNKTPPDTDTAKADEDTAKNEIPTGADKSQSADRKACASQKHGGKWHLAWNKLRRDMNRIHNFSKEQIAVVWQPTFSIWERWCCYVKAPIVHFQARAVIYTGVVMMFTYLITEVQIKTKLKASAEVEAAAHNLEQMQALQRRVWFVALYMFGSAFIEMRQMWMSGPMDYIGDPWNFIDISTLVMFFLGYFLQHVYRSVGWLASLFDKSVYKLFDWPNPEDSTEVLDDQKKWYCICLLFCWLRLLHLYSVNKTLGTLVRAIWLMVKDIGTFIFVWGFFLMAFAAAMYAGEEKDDSNQSEQNLNEDNVQNWKSWWILRTYFQAYGEIDLDKLNDWVSVSIFMVLLLVLQLVLNNTVFVAVLTTKFETVLEESETDWMFEMYEISEEFMEHPVPSPFNLLWMCWELWQVYKDETRVQALMKEEVDLCLVDEQCQPQRWWHFHVRLRNPRFRTAPLLPIELQSELAQSSAAVGSVTTDPQSQPQDLSNAAVASPTKPQDPATPPQDPSTEPQDPPTKPQDPPTPGDTSLSQSVSKMYAEMWKYLDGQNLNQAVDDNDRRQMRYRDGDVRRRDRALIMRAKARYLERQDASMGHSEEMRSRLKSVEARVKELHNSVDAVKKFIDHSAAQIQQNFSPSHAGKGQRAK